MKLIALFTVLSAITALNGCATEMAGVDAESEASSDLSIGKHVKSVTRGLSCEANGYLVDINNVAEGGVEVYLIKKASPGQLQRELDNNFYRDITQLSSGIDTKFIVTEPHSQVKITISGLASSIYGKFALTYTNGLIEQKIVFPKGSCESND